MNYKSKKKIIITIVLVILVFMVANYLHPQSYTDKNDAFLKNLYNDASNANEIKTIDTD